MIFLMGFLCLIKWGGFKQELDMTIELKKLYDSYIWLMNMASHYHDCQAEYTIKDIAFKMQIHL